jgi:tetratricopeptide (TPR) repeat protein
MNKRSYKDQSPSTQPSRKKATPSSITPTQQASWKHYFQDGCQAFKASQYKEALDYFTQAVLLEPTNINLLDSRVVTYEKLHQWDLAIQDAKTMVKLSPTSSKGYLRYGKLLSSHHQRHSSAAKVYQRGCDMVDPNDTRYALLASLKQDMEAHIAKAKQRRDPLLIMPIDVLDLIFSYLPFHRRVACMLVNRTWRHYLVTWRGMWRNMDLVTGALRHNIVSRKTLAQYLSYTQGRHLRRFSLSADRAKTDYALQLLIDQDCHYLEYLGKSSISGPSLFF